jgi:uncharacterized membrane-anchored protein
MKKWPLKNWIIVVLILQLAALASIAGKREWIRTYGERVYLRTAPVDPRDIFRGDYVQLEYEISQPDTTLLPKNVAGTKYQLLYLQLQRDARGIGQLSGITTEKPQGLFIKGFIDQSWGWRNNSLIKLGIEKYFVEQGSGLALEEKRGRAQDWQTPMEMEVALGSDGTAVIRGYRWSDMGIRLEVLEEGRNNNTMNQAQNTNTEPLRISTKLRISLRNLSKQSVRFIDSAEHCAFNLVENGFNDIGSGQSYKAMATPYRPCAEPVTWIEHELTPGMIYTFDVDLAEQQWHILHDGKEQELGALQNNWSGYRWIYQLPESVRKAHTNESDVWLSSLRTARFNAGGRID